MDEEERKRMLARFDELGIEQVRSLAAIDGFPMTWRAGVHEWLGGKGREGEKTVKGKKGA